MDVTGVAFAVHESQGVDAQYKSGTWHTQSSCAQEAESAVPVTHEDLMDEHQLLIGEDAVHAGKWFESGSK